MLGVYSSIIMINMIRLAAILPKIYQTVIHLPFSFACVPVHGYEDVSGAWEELLQAALLCVIAQVANKQTVGRGTGATPTTTTYIHVHAKMCAHEYATLKSGYKQINY